MPLLTVRAAAERLGVGYSTLKRWIASGHVRTTRTEGGHHRISDAEIERLIAKHNPEHEPAPRPAQADELIAGLSARNRLHGFVEEVPTRGWTARAGQAAGRRSVADRGDHRGCGPRAEAAPR